MGSWARVSCLFDSILPGALFALATMLAGCATLADLATGSENPPSAGAGPFRELVSGELGQKRVAPYAMVDNETFLRDITVVDPDGDPSTLTVYGYFAMTPLPVGQDPSPEAPPRAIVRFTALDLRSFDRTPMAVLEPALPWEGDTVGAPSAVRSGDGSIWLYYAAAGGIGVARSPDGITFTRDDLPVLGPDAGGWEQGAIPQSPGVVALWDGSLRMFYEIASPGGAVGIGEARSDDGKTWTRVGGGPAIGLGVPDASGDEAYDSTWVGSPAAVVVTSPEGQSVLRLYYGARNAAGMAVIGLAARRELSGPLQRAVSPVFGSGSSLAPREPWVVAGDGFSLLFVTQKAGRNQNQNYPAVAAGVSPGNAVLPPANPQ